jgi:aminoglycoside phosphotransferase (APT) family kinase protein
MELTHDGGMDVTGVETLAGVAPELVDPVRLAAWMDGQGLGEGPLTDAERLAGGTQNILIRFRRAGRSYVLRRPPEHKRGNSDETMRREAVLLAGLAGTDVPHPALIAACPELDVLGSAFYLMEPIDGVNPTAAPTDVHRADRGVQREMGLGMATVLAALGRVDPVAAGVAHLGRAEGWLERQVARWRRQLDSYCELGGWTHAELPDPARLEAWLEANRPARWRAGLIHGDFHFSNVMVSRTGPEIVAVVDWELGTIGDPLLDLGHLLATWPEPDGATAATILALPGLPSRAELVARYAEGSDRDLEHVEWYRALACYRLGVLLEGSHARHLAGQATAEVGDRLHATARALFEQGLSIAG